MENQTGNKKINVNNKNIENCTWKKVFIIGSIIFTILFIIILIVCIWQWVQTGANMQGTGATDREILAAQGAQGWSLFRIAFQDDKIVNWNLSGLGIWMCIWLSLIVIADIFVIIFCINKKTNAKKQDESK